MTASSPRVQFAQVPDYIGRSDLPKYYPICERKVDILIARGDIPLIRLGRRVIFRRQDVEAYLDSFLVTAATAEAEAAPRRPGRPRKRPVA